MSPEPIFQRKIERLCRLGPRPVGELFIEIINKVAAVNPEFGAFAAERLDKYAALDPSIVRDLGADQFPKPHLQLVRR